VIGVASRAFCGAGVFVRVGTAAFRAIEAIFIYD